MYAESHVPIQETLKATNVMTTQRILTTHAGSLPRPASLSAMHGARFRGETINLQQLEAEIETATQNIVAKQIESGVDLINDGEMGRESFFTYVQHQMTGFGGRASRKLMRDMTMYPTFLAALMRSTGTTEVSLLTPPQAIGDVRYKNTQTVDAECARLARLLRAHGREPGSAFVTAPSPGIIAAAMENKHYASMSDYIDALAIALRNEYLAIHNAGFTLQIDAPDLAMERHTLFGDKPLNDFLDFARLVIAAITRATAGIPRERWRLHVCWGNYNGPHECDVALEDVWPVIALADPGALLISLANPRHEHEVALFRNGVLPANTTLVAGVIDTTTNYVEHPEVVAQRIERAVVAVGDPARVLAGTDCGFETSAGFPMVAEEVVWAKLRALRDGAALASQRLF